jgi:hypothetical protein
VSLIEGDFTRIDARERIAISPRQLDFIVIGTQKGGTTALWQYLRGHPAIYLPEDKEAPFFCTPAASEPRGLARFMDLHFGEAPPGMLLGKVTPHYMMGHRGVQADLIAQRIASALPEVRIIALLRNPIERAISHYRMSRRRGLETRSFDHMAHDLLTPRQLSGAREAPTETNSYLTQGEYGRILAGYRRHFPPSRLHVELTEELASDPVGVIDRVLGFLCLEPGYRPTDLGVRHHRGGLRRRVDGEAEQQLRAFLGKQVWGSLGKRSERVQHAFNFFFETWNVVPDDQLPPVSPQTRAALEAHYARDAHELAALGVVAPWIARVG